MDCCNISWSFGSMSGGRCELCELDMNAGRELVVQVVPRHQCCDNSAGKKKRSVPETGGFSCKTLVQDNTLKLLDTQWVLVFALTFQQVSCTTQPYLHIVGQLEMPESRVYEDVKMKEDIDELNISGIEWKKESMVQLITVFTGR